MNNQTAIALKDWANRVNNSVLSIIPPSTGSTPTSRKEAALKSTLKTLDRKMENLEALEAYLEFASKVLESNGE